MYGRAVPETSLCTDFLVVFCDFFVRFTRQNAVGPRDYVCT